MLKLLQHVSLQTLLRLAVLPAHHSRDGGATRLSPLDLRFRTQVIHHVLLQPPACYLLCGHCTRDL